MSLVILFTSPTLLFTFFFSTHACMAFFFFFNCHISYFQVQRMFSQANSNITVCGFHIQYIFNSFLVFFSMVFLVKKNVYFI